jgi:hypothetical protein
MATSVPATIARVVARSCALVGVAAGFWHLRWTAGAALLASTLVAAAVQSAGWWRLRRDQAPTPE